MLADVAPAVAGASDVAPQSLRLVVNVDANHKVVGSLVLLIKEVVEPQVNARVSNGAVVDAKYNHDIGRPDFALATAPAATIAYFQSTRIMTAVVWVGIR